MTNNNTGNPALRAQREKEAKQEKAPKVSTFKTEEFWEDIKSRSSNGSFGAGSLIVIGLTISSIIWILKYFNIAKENSLVGSIKMSSLMESMFHDEAPLLFGAIMYGILFILFTMKDWTIALAIKLYDFVLAAAITAAFAALVIMIGHAVNLLSFEPNWLTLWSMTLNYVAVALFAVKFIFVSSGMEKSPNRGTRFQYFGLIAGYFGGGAFMVFTGLDAQALTLLGIVCGVFLLIIIAGVVDIGREKITNDPHYDAFFGGVSMFLVAIMYAGLLYIACNISFSTKEIVCYFDFDSLTNECQVFKESFWE